MTTHALGGLPALDAALAAVVTRLRQSTATIEADRGRRSTGMGAAVIWSSAGLLLTNAHVAHGPSLVAALPDGRRVPARVLARDPAHDLAALQIDPGDLPLTPATLGDPSSLRPGALVLAFGHPLGVSNALAIGIINASTAPDSRQHRGRTPTDLLRADIRLAPGNSGGPLADAAGRVLGINTLIANGLGYAVSVDRARRFVAALAPRPRLGLTVRTVRVRQRDGVDAPDAALLVLAVAPGLPADRAGLLPGDVLFALGDLPLRTPDDLLAALAALATLAAGRTGEASVLAIGRGGRRSVRTITPDDVIPHASRAA